ncbi:MAG: FkbM family methyltransferase [SAR324 cluster bacterium]|nr:FkbM family methyltransferase [SAR324 cluster bacterium]
MIKYLLKKLIPTKYWETPDSFYHLYLNSHAGTYYSQEGEDILLSRIFGGQSKGFYVDVGAHHPRRFSNTYLFYKRGWRGINIDALPGSMKVFQKLRPCDKNLELAVSDREQVLTYYMFNEPALNGFSKNISEKRQTDVYKITNTKDVIAFPLYTILDKHLPMGQSIDFLSVDVEGLDLKVLESNDWDKYSPKIILVEILGNSISTIESDPVYNFLVNQGYSLFAKLIYTCIFKLKE